MASCTAPELGSLPGAPLKVAVMVCGPAVTLRDEVVKVACPEPSSKTPAARTVGPSRKVTEPAVTGLPPAVTVAVKVTDCPYVDEGREDATAVVVATVG